jgi:hypothetical protein
LYSAENLGLEVANIKINVALKGLMIISNLYLNNKQVLVAWLVGWLVIICCLGFLALVG